MTETSGMVQITNRLINVRRHCITFVIMIILKILHRVEPGNFRIGRVGKAHNDYYEVALKDRYDDYDYVDDFNDVNHGQGLNGNGGIAQPRSRNMYGLP